MKWQVHWQPSCHHENTKPTTKVVTLESITELVNHHSSLFTSRNMNKDRVLRPLWVRHSVPCRKVALGCREEQGALATRQRALRREAGLLNHRAHF